MTGLAEAVLDSVDESLDAFSECVTAQSRGLEQIEFAFCCAVARRRGDREGSKDTHAAEYRA